MNDVSTRAGYDKLLRGRAQTREIVTLIIAPKMHDFVAGAHEKMFELARKKIGEF